MVEDRSVAEKTHEIINLEHALADAEMKLPEKFLIMSIVDKISKSWKNFGMTLKHQKGRLSLEDLMITINIKEEHRNQTHKMPIEYQPRINLIVEKQKVNKAKTGQTVVNMVVGGSSSASTLGATEGANVHICADKSLSMSYQAINGRMVSMGNSSTAEVLGIRSVDLKFPSDMMQICSMGDKEEG
ncbi:UNVERIFIED_CONTAM: hypothetical protein Sangu_2519100 [Sesamum angustifolium]|uniref:Uncharacterized protein n=1 Tax=Sesamum angustifolium TaxID=2727405 RepID=A0AAW2JIQ5_9LAMI